MRVLVPIDDSDPARNAIEFAAKEHPDAEIIALHVIGLQGGAYGEGAMFAYDELMEAQEERAEGLLEEVSAIAAEHDVEITTETIVGQPSREIVDYADEHDIDRIVIGSHGRTGASRVLLGSVAERVVRRAPMPVTIVR